MRDDTAKVGQSRTEVNIRSFEPAPKPCSQTMLSSPAPGAAGDPLTRSARSGKFCGAASMSLAVITYAATASDL